jgi:hypothetical protein
VARQQPCRQRIEDNKYPSARTLGHARTAPDFRRTAYIVLTFIRRRECKQEIGPAEPIYRSILIAKFGAGEGIRTLDPNLGNVPGRFTPQHLFLSETPLSPYRVRLFLARPHSKPILLLPGGFRSVASPLLPRPPQQIRGSRLGTSTEQRTRDGSWLRLPNVSWMRCSP